MDTEEKELMVRTLWVLESLKGKATPDERAYLVHAIDTLASQFGFMDGENK